MSHVINPRPSDDEFQRAVVNPIGSGLNPPPSTLRPSNAPSGQGWPIQPLPKVEFDSIQKCSLCKAEYNVIPAYVKGRPDIQVPSCDCRAEQVRIVEQKTMEKLQNHEYALTGIPKRMLNYSFDSWLGDVNLAMSIQRWIRQEHPGIAVLVGNTGTGKSGLAASCCKIFHDDDKTIKYAWAYDVLTHGTNFESRMETLGNALKPDLLVIDEIGIQLNSDPAKDFFSRLLIGRHEDNKTTILISNLTPKEFWERVGFRMRDRIESTGLIIPFMGDNLRKTV